MYFGSLPYSRRIAMVAAIFSVALCAVPMWDMCRDFYLVQNGEYRTAECETGLATRVTTRSSEGAPYTTYTIRSDDDESVVIKMDPVQYEELHRQEPETGKRITVFYLPHTMRMAGYDTGK